MRNGERERRKKERHREREIERLRRKEVISFLNGKKVRLTKD